MKPPEKTDQKAQMVTVPIPFPIHLAVAINEMAKKRGATFATTVLELLEGTNKIETLAIFRRGS